jgi:hypothetical protein
VKFNTNGVASEADLEQISKSGALFVSNLNDSTTSDGLKQFCELKGGWCHFDFRLFFLKKKKKNYTA